MYLGDGTRVQVDFPGVVRLHLNTGIFLELQNTAYVPAIRIDLISIPILDRFGYNFLFGSEKIKLYRGSLLIGNEIFCGSLYILELFVLPYVSIALTVKAVSITKHLRLNEIYTLWHKRLDHISR